MIRGRLVAINGKAVTPDDYDRRARQAPGRPRVQPQPRRRAAARTTSVVGGRWTADEADALSVEEGLAKTLGLKLGDTLRFDIAGTPAEGRITSLRKVDWGSMRVNFFVMFPAARDGRRAGDLHRRVPRAGRDSRLRQRAQRATSRTSPTSTCRPRSRRCSACSTR